jgi:hypothetical protein
MSYELVTIGVVEHSTSIDRIELRRHLTKPEMVVLALGTQKVLVNLECLIAGLQQLKGPEDV